MINRRNRKTFRESDAAQSPGNADQRQFAALPYLVSADGLRILLITSRETRRWVIPKGWPIRGSAGYEVAEKEAVEEAGVEGLIARKPTGVFHYSKRLHFFSSVNCEVEVYPLRVDRQKLRWRERAQRQLVWVSPEEAAARVQEEELAQLLQGFSPGPAQV